MRIGILTLQDSPNYGAVLQAYALRAHLASLGHQAFVIDRRRNGTDVPLRTPAPMRDAVRLLGAFPVDACNGAREYARRCERTLSFLRERVRLSPYHFGDWAEAPRDLALDVIVVGSDQVWNANNLDPDDYLLKHVPGSPRGIAYAASIGMPEFPPDRIESFRDGFGRFAAIGVRERESAEMIRSLGFAAEHVVDPVFLADPSVWDGLLRSASARTGRTFAYFLAEDFESLLPEFARHVERTGRRVDFLADWFVRCAPRGVGGWMRNRRFRTRWRRAGIDFRLDYGPEEFVQAIATADAVVSNSYHALMFALLFGKEVRIVLPTHPVRCKMNVRFREFEELASGEPFVFDGLPAALRSLESGAHAEIGRAVLSDRIAASREWLKKALDAAD